MKYLAAFLFLACGCAAQAELTFPVDTAEWEGRTAYLIVPTDTNELYQLRYYPDGSTYGDWPRHDGDNFGTPLPTVDPEPEGLVYPIRLLDEPNDPQFHSTIEKVVTTVHYCGPFESDVRQPPACGSQTDVILSVKSKEALPESDVLRNANSAAGEKYYELYQADGWEIREALQSGINMAKDRQVNLGSLLTRIDNENWQIQVNYFQEILAKTRKLRAQIKCKYDLSNCSYNVNGASVDVDPVTGADFETGWPELPEIPEL